MNLQWMRQAFFRLALGVVSGHLLLAQSPVTAPQPEGITTIRTSVRRVIVDVVVTDHAGQAVPGLGKDDFIVYEDKDKQNVLSFDRAGFGKEMDYLPPKLPPQPPNTFVNLPVSPEKGPLYVLLYDLVNTEKNEDQTFARKQLIKFIAEKPEGARFAIFMLSDGLHMVQGFTSDKKLLFAAVDPSHTMRHVPKIFLMGRNFGQNDPGTAVLALQYLASYLNGLPGRKNIIWFAGNFPLVLFPSNDESAEYIEESRKTLDLLARSQIAIYPIDMRGVVVENAHAPSGSTGGGGVTSDSRGPSGGGSASGGASGSGGASSSSSLSPGSAAAAGSIAPGAGGIGYNMLSSSYATAEEIARATGGKSFVSTNDVAGALVQATVDGGSYYTVSYAPSGAEHDGKLHAIRVEVARKGCTLAYRRAYYSPDARTVAKEAAKGARPPVAAGGEPRRAVGDSLDANMRHGAPVAHALIFGAHIDAVGEPAMATPEQMAQLADEQAFSRARRGTATVKPRTPVKLQRYEIRYTVMTHQLESSSRRETPSLELAAAAYDADGAALNAVVNVATRDAAQAGAQPAYRAVQELLAPLNAASIRLAVRDADTDRIGAMEVALPLAVGSKTAVGAGGSGGAP